MIIFIILVLAGICLSAVGTITLNKLRSRPSALRVGAIATIYILSGWSVAVAAFEFYPS
jgi:hypothetical protein